jgi:beta-lactam-binding protein with PASTA domain
MSTKDFFDKLFSRFVIYNLLAMAVVVVLLCVGVKIGLDVYTHHGEGIAVPNVKGMSYDKAYLKLTELGLGIVVSDSGYNKKMPANAVLAQTPGQGQRVKQGHVIYVTVNSPSSPTFAIPDIVDNSSVREAEAKLTAMGFRMLPPQLVDGEKDWVYGIVCRGRRVSNGDRISTDYPLMLMVGRGTLDDMDDVNYVDSSYGEVNSETDDFEEVSGPPAAE